jgi:hypothetical protein
VVYLGVPIRIFKNGEFLKECINIQEAGKWLKEFTGDTNFRFAKIENGYCYNEAWDFKGARYTFKADEKYAKARRELLDGKRKKESSHKTPTIIFDREEYINHLSQNLYALLILKKEIPDDFLRSYHLKAKSIGDDLYFLTESYFRQQSLFKGKYSMADFITPRAKEVLESKDKSVKLIYEHMVPKNLYIKEIAAATISDNLTEEFIFNLLTNYYFVCTVTDEEDKKLPSTKMAEDWNKVNPFYRYEKAGIEFIPNR